MRDPLHLSLLAVLLIAIALVTAALTITAREGL